MPAEFSKRTTRAVVSSSLAELGRRCYLPTGARVEGVTDSKEITKEEEREAVFERIVGTPGVRYALAKAEAPVVDELNILRANLACMRAAGAALVDRLGGAAGDDAVVLDVTGDGAAQAAGATACLALVDGVDDPWRRCERSDVDVATIKKGDAHVACISAASILAKVTRDRMMRALDEAYPEYDWASNKASVRRAGVSPSTTRGGAAAATWIFRGDKSRRGRGRDMDIPWGRVAERRDSDVDISSRPAHVLGTSSSSRIDCSRRSATRSSTGPRTRSISWSSSR